MPDLLAIFLLLILVVVLTTQYVYLYRRINQIRRVIKAMSQGDFSSPMVVSPHDKLGDVARYLNELSSGIQKRLQETVNEKEKLEAMLSSMAEGVLVISAHERLIHLSPSFLSMFEVRSTDWQSKYYWEIIANPVINESIREAMVQRKVLRKEIVIVHPDEMYFGLLISPVFGSNGQLISLVAVFHDVTELKKYERLRSEFVANVSHELKTPLTSIKGFVETLQQGAVDDKANATKFLDIIAKQTQRLENLVHDLLIISSLESKEVKMSFVKTDIQSVIHSVIQLKKNQIESMKHTLTVSLPDNLPLVMIDAQRMEQVFINLLDNAIKFTPQGGKIEISAAVENNFLRVDVLDNGRGVSSEHLKRLFERFFRVDKSRSNETGGTGLGLSIVKHIVEAHQGRISVESILGRGCRFSVFLPLAML